VQTTTDDRAARLARRAQQANARIKPPAKPQPPAYTVMAPYVPEQAIYRDQRTFSRGNENRSLSLSTAKKTNEYDYISTSSEVSVMRWADKDVAQLTSSLSINRSDCQITLHCTAAELRDIAYRLLDAAHDLEDNPSRALLLEAA
jgi:hypothetical protein